MTALIFNAVGIVAFGTYLYYLFKNSRYAISIAIFILLCGPGMGFLGNETIVKLLIIAAIVLSILRHGMSSSFVLPFIIFLMMVLFNSMMVNQTLSLFEQFASWLSLIIGIAVFLVKWNEQIAVKTFKLLSYAAPLNVLLGIIQYGNIVTSRGRIATVSYTAYAVVIACFGFMTSFLLFEHWGEKKYLKLCLLNAVISLCTMQRMGNLLLLVMIVCILYKKRKKFKRKYMQYIILAAPFAGAILYTVGTSMLERTFSKGYGDSSIINTSSRSYIWEKMLALTEDAEWWGRGIGYVKTLNFAFWSDSGAVAAHNEYIRFRLEMGYIGLVVMIAIFVYIFRKVWKEAKRNGIYLINATILFFPIYSYTDNTISSATFFYLYMLILVLIYYSMKQRGKLRTYE